MHLRSIGFFDLKNCDIDHNCLRDSQKMGIIIKKKKNWPDSVCKFLIPSRKSFFFFLVLQSFGVNLRFVFMNIGFVCSEATQLCRLTTNCRSPRWTLNARHPICIWHVDYNPYTYPLNSARLFAIGSKKIFSKF